MNKPLTPEEALNLTFPCLLEIWNQTRISMHDVVLGLTAEGNYIKFTTLSGANYAHAALPSPEITEAMRKQFAPQSEYPKRMLVWNGSEEPEPRIVLSDLGEKAIDRYIVVAEGDEIKYQNGDVFNWSYYSHAKTLPEPDQISQEIAELRQRLADLEAKHNQ